MNTVSAGAGYSSRVRLRLERNGEIIPLAQVAPEWIMPVQPRDLPPCEAHVVVQVDGVDHPRRVYLPEGMSVSRSKAEIADVGHNRTPSPM